MSIKVTLRATRPHGGDKLRLTFIPTKTSVIGQRFVLAVPLHAMNFAINTQLDMCHVWGRQMEEKPFLCVNLSIDPVKDLNMADKCPKSAFLNQT